jgi:acylphosphatase
MPRLNCIVRGRVQGVGFRYFARNEAIELGLRGWVRNLRGGDVETEVEGAKEALNKYLLRLREGPAFGCVTEVVPAWEEIDGVYNSFQVKPTI